MNRSPAFQFYPDKWQSHTRRLSDSAYRVYHELLCWMWQSSPDQCSIEASVDAVSCAVAIPYDVADSAMRDIQNPYCPLLREEDGKWISNGLRKAKASQDLWHNRGRSGARARWGQCSSNAQASNSDAQACENDAQASVKQCPPSPSPSPNIETKVSMSDPENPQGGCSGEPQENKSKKSTPEYPPAVYVITNRLHERIRMAHPHSKPPTRGSSGYMKDCETVDALIRLDKYEPKRLVEIFKWLFDADHKQAEFWRKQVQGIQGLRKKSDGNSMTKMQRIEEEYADACERQ